MDLGLKVNFLRRCKGLTQQELGEAVGFKESSARIRISQYEASTRIPKEDILKKLAEVLTVHPLYLTTPAEYSSAELMHMFFSLESARHIDVEIIDGVPYLKFSSLVHDDKLLLEWYEMKEKLLNNEITREEYAWWKYRYPKKVKDFEDATANDSLDYDVLTVED